MGLYDLKGYLRVVALPELMNLLQSSEKTGFLYIHSGSQIITIVFRKGTIALIQSINTNFTLLRLCKDHGLLTTEEIQLAEMLINDPRNYLGLALIRHSFLDAGIVIELTKELIPHEMAESLKIHDGEFQFCEGDISDVMPLPVALPVPFVIMHASMRLDEMQRVEAQAGQERGNDIRPRVGKLVQILGGKIIGNHTLRLGSNIVGNQKDSHILIEDDPIVSPKHARIYLTGLNYYLDNLGEFATVRVNGMPVKRQQLFDGDEIQVGKYRFLFHRMLLKGARTNSMM